MAVKYYLSQLPFEMELEIVQAFNKLFHRRPSSKPFLAGDTYRELAEVLYDNTHHCDASEINNCTSEIPVVFVSSWVLMEFVEKVLPEVTKKFVLITHQGDVNITNTEEYKKIADNELIVHWFPQNCLLEHPKVTPLIIGLEDAWRHNAGALGDFKKKKYTNVKKDAKILLGLSLNTNPQSRVPCYVSLSGKQTVNEVYRSGNSHNWRKKLAKCMFVASPLGNGLDCHRTWEGLYFNTIPICEDNYMNRYYASLGLPIWLIQNRDWDSIAAMSEEQLIQKYNELMSNTNFEALWLDYWETKINEYCICRS